MLYYVVPTTDCHHEESLFVRRQRGDPFERITFYKTDFFDHAVGVTHVAFGSSE